MQEQLQQRMAQSQLIFGFDVSCSSSNSIIWAVCSVPRCDYLVHNVVLGDGMVLAGLWLD
jgi:hypothetical protein